MNVQSEQSESTRPMRTPWWYFLVLMVALTALTLGDLRTLSAQDIELATDAPAALSPEESQQLFRLPQGFRIELVASEPHVADPVAMAFDAQGRILVCEIHGYNLEGYLDILELNKTGTLDTAVRRILANDRAIQQAQQEQYGTVKLLTDTDGDGRVDRATVWADRLPPCYGVVPATRRRDRPLRTRHPVSGRPRQRWSRRSSRNAVHRLWRRRNVDADQQSALGSRQLDLCRQRCGQRRYDSRPAPEGTRDSSAPSASASDPMAVPWSRPAG